MPAPGLSLVGFMDQAAALTHLEKTCVPTNGVPATLLADWQAAQAQLGAPTANAGLPQILPLPASAVSHIQQLKSQPWMQPHIANPFSPLIDFMLVEIDPLLAFQHVVNKNRSLHHSATLSGTPSLDEMLNICLPIVPIGEKYDAQQQANSLIIKAQSLNLRVLHQGLINPEFAGILIGPSLAVTQVSFYQGKYYLGNGFHRAYCLRSAGVTHMPCMVRAPASPEMLGINQGTFALNLLQSDNPPTLSHFTTGRAWDVQIRNHSRVITISWSEWAVTDE